MRSEMNLAAVRLAREVADEFTSLHHDLLDPSSATDTALVTPAQHRNRMILKKAFEKQGFANYSPEWWHYRLLNEPAPSLHYYFPVWDGMASR